MTGRVVETVTFNLNEGVSRDHFLATNPVVERFLEESPGFLTRRLAEGEDGSWVDHVEWRSMAEALTAGEQMIAREDMKPFLDLIRPDSVSINHRHLVISQG